jgi:endonuclease YncB( thermonuclease family)
LQETLHGKVIAVSDGDTLTILDGREQHKIRLFGIDSPERGQPFSQKAKQFTSEAAFGKQATIEVVDVDQYGRIVGEVFLPGARHLNAELVREGFAWWYRKYAQDEKHLEELEAEARKEKRGLWADEHPVPPWEWRKHEKERSEAGSREATSSDSGQANNRPPATIEGDYWLNTSTGVRHNRGCENFGKTKRGRVCRPDEGKPCGMCGG